MSRIFPEKEISYISKVIEKNIFYYDSFLKDKGFLSENILSQLRNLVEDVAILINNELNNKKLDVSFDNVKPSFDVIKGIKKYKFLRDFHEFLQSTASHYTPSEDGAERLVKYYFRYICLIKKFLKDEFDISIINNIDLFPYYDDKSMKDNYDLIYKKINSVDYSLAKQVSGKFYIEKCNTIFSNGDIFYEYTLTKATDYSNKFERLTFYSKIYIPDNYSVNIYSVDDNVNLNVGEVDIRIITWYKVSIRTCELKNLFKIFGVNLKLKEYENLMGYLTDNETSILNILLTNDSTFNDIVLQISDGGTNHNITDMLKKIRKIVIFNKKGSNILRYLTFRMVNVVIRNQIGDRPHPYLSNLFFHKSSSMFDLMPFAMSLHNHNPRLIDLMNSIDSSCREDELLYSFIKHNTEQNDVLFTPINEISYFDDIPELVESFNEKIRPISSASSSKLILDNNYLYIKEYEDNSLKIILSLDMYSSNHDDDLINSIKLYFGIINNDNAISDDKKRILEKVHCL